VREIADAHTALLQHLADITGEAEADCGALTASSSSAHSILTTYEASTESDCDLFRHLPQQDGISFRCLDDSPPPQSPSPQNPPPPSPPPDRPLAFAIADLTAATSSGELDAAVLSLAADLLKELPPGTQFSLSTDSFDAAVARTTMPLPGDTLPEGGIPMSSFVAADGTELRIALNAPEALLGGSDESVDVNVFTANLNPAAPALQALGQVDSIVIAWANNEETASRFATPPSNESVTVLDSAVTTLTLLDDSGTVDVASPNAAVFRIPFSLRSPNPSELECGRPQEACDNETIRLQRQVTSKEEECDQLGAKAVWGRGEFDACRETMLALDANLSYHVANICKRLPAPCSGRGNCTAESPPSIIDTCTCNPGWSGAQCDEERLCRFYDSALPGWSTEGCRTLSIVENQTTGVGSMLCACDHLTDFAVAAAVMANPAAFFNSLSSLEINIPIPLSLDELIRKVEDMPVQNWVGMGVMLLLMGVGVRTASKCDDHHAYRAYHPGWVGKLLGSNNRQQSWVRRALMIQMALFLAGHPVVGLFLALPGSHFSRAQKAVIVYLLLLLQFYGQLLFWGAGNEGPFVRVWAFIIDYMISLLAEGFAATMFAYAMVEQVTAEPELHIPTTKEDLPPWHVPTWECVCRQTVPPPNEDTFHMWRYPMLLASVPDSDDFFSDKLTNTKLFTSTAGRLGCKLVYSQRSMGRYRPRMVIKWVQSSDLSAQNVVGFTEVAGFAVPAQFGGLKRGNRMPSGSGVCSVYHGKYLRAQSDLDPNVSGALGNRIAMYQGGCNKYDQPIFLVGQPTPNQAGALTGEGTQTRYQRVELYLMQKGGERNIADGRFPAITLCKARITATRQRYGNILRNGKMDRVSAGGAVKELWRQPAKAAKEWQYRFEDLLARKSEQIQDAMGLTNVDTLEHRHKALSHAGTFDELPASRLLRLPDESVGFFAVCESKDALISRRTKGIEAPFPKFVTVLALSRVRLPGSKAVLYRVRYDLDSTRGEHLDVSCVHEDPMSLYSSLGQLYWSRMLDGWTHTDAMTELDNLAQLPAGWRGAKLFTGDFEIAKLRFAWAVVGSFLLLVVIMVFVGIITLSDTVSMGEVIISMVINLFAVPIFELLKMVCVGLAVFRLTDWLKARVARRRLKTAGNKIRKLSMATSLIKMGCLAGCSAPAGGAQRKSMTLSTIKSQSEAAKAAAQDSEDKLDDLDRIRLQVERSSTQDRPLWRPRERPQRIVPFAAESEVNGEHPCHAQLRWLSANEDHPLENAPLELSEHAHGTTDESRTTAIVPGAADRRLSRDGTRTHQLRAKLQKFPSQHVTTACAPNAKASMRQLRTKDDVLQQMHAKLQQMRARNAQAPRHTWSAGKDVLSGSATPSSSSNSAACPARDGERPVAPIAAAAAMAAMQPTIAKATEATEGIGCAPQPRPQSAALLRARRHREESRTATPSCSSNGTACPAREGERAVPSIAAAAATAMQPTIAEGVEGNGCAPQPRPLGASLARARRHRDESRTATPSCSSNGTAC